jgi:SAM-dependent methyltransferase
MTSFSKRILGKALALIARDAKGDSGPTPEAENLFKQSLSNEPSSTNKAVSRYLAGGRIPFSSGYTEYKEGLLRELCSDPVAMRIFRTDEPLPADFGTRLDERIVEYPWVLSRLPDTGLIVDAGSTFNKAALLAMPQLRDLRIIVYTLETDWIIYNPTLSYVFGDLRDMVLKDAIADTLVCISTLEHVGFTYDYKTYSRLNPWPHQEPESYLRAIMEFRRVLHPGGHLLLTVPFGTYENHGWLQQFDGSMIDAVKETFGGRVLSENYFRYADGAWRRATRQECAGLSYFNFHEAGRFEQDGLAAARAVACLDLERSER